MDRDERAVANAMTRGQQTQTRGVTSSKMAPRAEGYATRRYAMEGYDLVNSGPSEIVANHFNYIGANGVPRTIDGRRSNIQNLKRTSLNVAQSKA